MRGRRARNRLSPGMENHPQPRRALVNLERPCTMHDRDLARSTHLPRSGVRGPASLSLPTSLALKAKRFMTIVACALRTASALMHMAIRRTSKRGFMNLVLVWTVLALSLETTSHGKLGRGT